jgi:hypothetical protein
VAAVDDGTRPFDLARLLQLREQQRVQLLPHAGRLPLVEATPAGRAGSKPELERQMPPGDPRVQHEQDSLQRLPLAESLTARIPKPSGRLRQQR